MADKNDGASGVDIGQGSYEVVKSVGSLCDWFVVMGGRVGKLGEAGEDGLICGSV